MIKKFMAEKKWFISLLITFLICYIPRMLMGFILTPYSNYDEGTVLSSAAYFAGKDWSSITSVSSYYGFGYYGLFAPIFKLTDNPYVIYFIITEVNAFVQALYGIIAFRIMHKFFIIDNVFIITSISCICSYLTTVRPIVYNEVPLVLLVWVATYLLCALIYYRCDKKNKNLYSILLFLVMAYALTIHTRSIILLMGLAIVVLVYLLLYKEWLISIKTVPFCVCAVAVARYSVKLVQNIVWKAGERTSIANTSIDLGITELNWFDPTTWRGFFLVFVGQMSTINLFSGGLFVMAIYVLIKYVISNWKNFRDSEENRYYISINLLFLLCCFGMVAGQGMSWMYSIYPNIVVNKVGSVYGYKAFSYIRYMGAFIGPFILCAMLIVNKVNGKLKKFDIWGIIFVQLFVLLLWYKYVFPLLEGNPYAMEAYVPFSFRKPYDLVSVERYRVALPWSLVMIIFMLTYLLKKNWKVYYVFVLGLLIFQASYMAIYNDSPYGKDRSAAAATCYEFFTELSQELEIPETIYSYEIDKQRLQFYLNNYQIAPNIPEVISDDTIFIYQGKLDNLVGIELEEWNYTLLGNNTYFFFQQEDYIDIIESMGYEIL